MICLQGMLSSVLYSMNSTTCILWPTGHSKGLIDYSGFLLCRKEYLKTFVEKEVGDRAVDAAA